MENCTNLTKKWQSRCFASSAIIETKQDNQMIIVMNEYCNYRTMQFSKLKKFFCVNYFMNAQYIYFNCPLIITGKANPNMLEVQVM